MKSSLPAALSDEITVYDLLENEFCIGMDSGLSNPILRTKENNFFEITSDENFIDNEDGFKKVLIYEKGMYHNYLENKENVLEADESASSSSIHWPFTIKMNKLGNKMVFIDDGVLVAMDKIDDKWKIQGVAKLLFKNGIIMLLNVKITNNQQHAVIVYENEKGNYELIIYDLMSKKDLQCLKHISSIQFDSGDYAINSTYVFANSISLCHRGEDGIYCANIYYDKGFSIFGVSFEQLKDEINLKSYCGMCDKASIVYFPYLEMIMLKTFDAKKEEGSVNAEKNPLLEKSDQGFEDARDKKIFFEALKSKVVFHKASEFSDVCQYSPNGNLVLFKKSNVFKILDLEDMSVHELCEKTTLIPDDARFVNDRLAFVISNSGVSFFAKNKKTWVSYCELSGENIFSIFISTDFTKLMYYVNDGDGLKIKCRKILFDQKNAVEEQAPCVSIDVASPEIQNLNRGRSMRSNLWPAIQKSLKSLSFKK